MATTFGTHPSNLPIQIDGAYAASTTDVIATKVTADVNYRWIVNADGILEWGDGTNAVDTNLYRSAADTLTTDDAFRSATYVATAAQVLGTERTYYVGKLLGTVAISSSTGCYILLDPLTASASYVSGILFGLRGGGNTAHAGRIEVHSYRDTIQRTATIRGTMQPYVRTQMYQVTYSGTDYFAVKVDPTGDGRIAGYWSFTGWCNTEGGADSLRVVEVTDANISAASAFTPTTASKNQFQADIVVPRITAPGLGYAAATDVLILAGGGVANVHPHTGTATYGVASTYGVPTTSTTSATGLYAQIATQAAAYTVANAYGAYVASPSIGATSAITNVYGGLIKAQTGGATASYGLAIEAATTQTLWVGSGADGTTSAAGIAFGSSRDTVLYRSAANELKTDDSMYVALNLGLGVTPTAKLHFAEATTAAGGISFGSDTTLYRSAADQLKTDDTFVAGANIQGANISSLGTFATGSLSADSLANIVLTVPGTGTTQYGIRALPTFPATTTVAGYGIQTRVATTAAAYTMASGIGLNIMTPSIGATSAVTNVYGILVSAQTGGATASYGVSIAGATTQTLWVSSNADNTSAAAGVAFGLSRDTTLYRSAANTLKIDNSLIVNSVMRAGSSVAVGSASDADSLFYASAAPLGTNIATFGLNISYTAPSTTTSTGKAGYLKASSAAAAFTVATLYGLQIDSPTVGAGSTATTVIGLKIESQTGGSTASYGIVLQAATTNTLWLSSDADNTTAPAGITFGLSKDTTLYRSAANELKTDDDFVARRFGANSVNSLVLYNGSGTHPGTGAFTYGFYSSFDAPATSTTLTCGGYFGARTAAAAFTCGAAYGVLVGTPTIGAGSAITSVYGIYVDRQIGGASSSYGVAIEAATTYTLWVSNATDPTTAAGGITFGSSGDTNLYRSAADTLKTGDYLHVVLGVGVGEAPLTDRLLHVAGNVNSGTSTYGAVINPEGGANNTVSVQGIYVRAQTDNVAFTCATTYGIHVLPTTAGAGSTITTNYGILVDSQTAGGSDYGVAIAAADTQTLWVGSAADSTVATAGVAFGSSRDTNLYRSAANTLKTDDNFHCADLYALNNLGVGSVPSTNVAVAVGLALSGTGTSKYGIYSTATANSSTTSVFYGSRIVVQTAAAAFTCATSYGFYIDPPTIGAGSAITNVYGGMIKAQTGGATGSFGLAVEAAATQTLWVSSNANNTTAAAGLAFGSSRDTVLYRSAADTLKTDDSLIIVGDLTLSASDIITDGTTGTRIGTATSQKIALWNATPDVQPTTAITGATAVINSGAAINDATTFDGYTIAKVVAALRRLGALA